MRFLFVDRIVDSSPGQLIRGIKHVTGDDTFLTIDEKGRACFIPSLIGETLGQLTAWNVMQHNGFSRRPVAGIVVSARLHRPAYIGETLLLESHIDNLDEHAVHYHSEARVGDELIFSVESALGPLLPMADFIAVDEVKQQYAEINNPGNWSAISLASTPRHDEELLVNSGFAKFSMNFDKICSSDSGISLVAEKRITRAAPFLPDHFPKKPVLPMTVLLECKLNLAREFVARAKYSVPYSVYELRKIKMNEFVHPGEVILCYVTVKRHTEDELILSFRSEVSGKRVCVVDVVLIPGGR
ncbi:3-hydroxyacyl-ACP dehydratase FabZ family protein [Legionella sp.]|uniref:3-hydroxyacyl-ACP dehydratase FabZ family protein n=1 Tax=Legionella sp. TaxID=459 RepID=UPI003CB3A6BB